MLTLLRGAAVVLVAALAAVLSSPAGHATTTPQATSKAPAVTGIPMPCQAKHPWPADSSLSEIKPQLEKNFGVDLRGSDWTNPTYRRLVKIVWQTLDGVSCTSFMDTIEKRTGGPLAITTDTISGFAWGDWSLTNPGSLTFDFHKWMTALEQNDPGRLVRLTIHEMAHAYSVDRGANPRYWSTFTQLYSAQGTFSDYGKNASETFADTVGYYVGRCALKNPYDTGTQDAYYDYVKTTIFGGREFGPAAGETVDCTVPSSTPKAAAPAAPKATPVVAPEPRKQGIPQAV